MNTLLVSWFSYLEKVTSGQAGRADVCVLTRRTEEWFSGVLIPVMRTLHSTHTDGPGKAAVMPADPEEGPQPRARGADGGEPWARGSTEVSAGKKGQGRVNRLGIV